MIVFWVHAIQRMFERAVSEEDVHHVLAAGETIEDYRDDVPYLSRLILGWRGPRPLHVVVACNVKADETIVITVYEPSPDEWEDGFRRRKR
ncbi:MAG TPA: DUF4258 domain-containing protein [Anaerolineales bacterium]|nr:DUF4258 domain-containing protein [Anaerolineales bacterium]